MSDERLLNEARKVLPHADSLDALVVAARGEIERRGKAGRPGHLPVQFVGVEADGSTVRFRCDEASYPVYAVFRVSDLSNRLREQQPAGTKSTA